MRLDRLTPGTHRSTRAHPHMPFESKFVVWTWTYISWLRFKYLQNRSARMPWGCALVDRCVAVYSEPNALLYYVLWQKRFYNKIISFLSYRSVLCRFSWKLTLWRLFWSTKSQRDLQWLLPKWYLSWLFCSNTFWNWRIMDSC